MALKIRMRKQGRTNRPFYRIVLTDSRSPRDGKYIETLGWYNPLEEEKTKNLRFIPERVSHWLSHGAILTEKVESLLKRAHPELISATQQKQIARKAVLKEKRMQRKEAVAS